MNANNSNSFVLLLRRRPTVLATATVVVITILIVALAMYSYHLVKVASYKRLAPIGVSLELAFTNPQVSLNEIILEYDYGYGFIAAHRQARIIHSRENNQLIEFSIPSWKEVGALRLSVKEEVGVIPALVTFAKMQKTITLDLKTPQSGVLLKVENLSSMLEEAPATNSIVNVN